MAVEPGQRYRDNAAYGGPQLVVIQSVEGDQVHGSYTPESSPGSVGANTWTISMIEAMELLPDDAA